MSRSLSRSLVTSLIAMLLIGVSAPAAAAATGKTVTVEAPERGRQGEVLDITVRLPGSVAAADGRVLAAKGAATLIGAAPSGGGRPLMPVDVANGFAFGAYGMETGGASSEVHLAVVPERAGMIVLRVIVDAASDADGRRVKLAGAKAVVRISVDGRDRVLDAPAGGPDPVAPRAAKPAKGIFGGDRIRVRDVDVARGAWMSARERAGVCAVPADIASGDANDDGCVDIVDVQALQAATGQPVAAASDASAAIASTDVDGGSQVLAATTAVTEPVYARTFTVNSPLDTADAAPGNGACADSLGRCTLRAAITEADRLTGNDRIAFNLVGIAPVTIQLSSRLPFITSGNGSLTIDGYSQPGARVNTAAAGSNAIPGVFLRGNGNSAREVALTITSGGNIVRGLVISNVYRGIFIDSPRAANNAIVGNWIGLNRDGSSAASGNFGIVLNVGANRNRIGSPDLADRNVIARWSKGLDAYGPGTDENVIQNNVFCMTPSGAAGHCGTGVDHDFGPKRELLGGSGANERNVFGPTYLQGIEYSHGFNPSLPPHQDESEPYTLRANRAIGNWVGFRLDGSYDPLYRSGLNASGGDNAQGINVYDGTYDHVIEDNHVGSVYDGIQVQSPDASGNIVRGNIIGQTPTGQAAPLSGWGVVVRWGATHNVVQGNTIRNAAKGGIGLLNTNNAGQPTSVAYNIRLSRNIVTNTSGPAIALFGDANGSVQPPVIASATTGSITGTAQAGSRVEVFHATRAAGASGLPDAFLGATTAAPDGTWTFAPGAGLSAGERVTALQIRPDDNSSALSTNVAVTAGVTVAPSFSSGASATFAVGTAGTFTVRATGTPTPSITQSGTLPAGVTFSDNGDGTGTLSGTPAAGTAGTYQLTFTASNGVSPNASQSFTLTVSAEATPLALAEDTFSRTVSSGWGTADTGGPWSLSGTASDWRVDGNDGVVRLATGGITRRAWLPQATGRDVSLVVAIARDKVATGGGTYAYLVARRIDASNEYRAKVRFAADGSVYVQPTRVSGGTEAAIGSEVLVNGLSPAPGDSIRVRAEFVGTSPTTVRIRAWAAGSSEPTAWQATGTDSTAALQAAGAVGLQVYVSSSTTNAPVEVIFDGFRAVRS